jgi:hypothetical protein
LIALAVTANKNYTRASRLMGISEEDEGFAALVDRAAAYELINLEEVREQRRLKDLSFVILAAGARDAASLRALFGNDE